VGKSAAIEATFLLLVDRIERRGDRREDTAQNCVGHEPAASVT
jgi:hypothetical protein